MMKTTVKNEVSLDGLSLQKATVAWLATVKAYNQCNAILEKRMAALGVQVGEHEILMNLAKWPDSTQQELAQFCFSAKSGISMMIAKMEKAGLVVRRADVTDARAKRVSLTAKGNRLAAKTLQVQVEVVKAMTQDIPPIELEVVHRVMNRASSQLDTMALI